MTTALFYESYANQLLQNSLPAHVGFRICAIRETFEESGVLLVRSLKDGNDAGSSSVRKVLSDDEVKSWRGKVHSNASMFMQLCRSSDGLLLQGLTH